ncbi:hypothetical protein CR513_37577, partial [Mucuna pruriens]
MMCNTSNSGENLGLKRDGFCLVLDSGPRRKKCIEKWALNSHFYGPISKKNLHFWPSTISKWLKIDIIMLCCVDLSLISQIKGLPFCPFTISILYSDQHFCPLLWDYVHLEYSK